MKDLRLVGFTGKARSGKDTAAKYLIDQGWLRLPFAEPVYTALAAINPVVPFTDNGLLLIAPLSHVVAKIGWEEAKKIPEVRQYLQRVGTEAGRDLHGPDCWVKINERRRDLAISEGGKVAVTDVRFDNEAASIVKDTGIVIEIIGPDRTNANVPEHRSEAGISEGFIDFRVFNTGTIEDLHKNVQKCLDAASGIPWSVPFGVTEFGEKPA